MGSGNWTSLRQICASFWARKSMSSPIAFGDPSCDSKPRIQKIGYSYVWLAASNGNVLPTLYSMSRLIKFKKKIPAWGRLSTNPYLHLKIGQGCKNQDPFPRKWSHYISIILTNPSCPWVGIISCRQWLIRDQVGLLRFLSVWLQCLAGEGPQISRKIGPGTKHLKHTPLTQKWLPNSRKIILRYTSFLPKFLTPHLQLGFHAQCMKAFQPTNVLHGKVGFSKILRI